MKATSTHSDMKLLPRRFSLISRLTHCVAVTLLLLINSLVIQAQDYKQVAPKSLPARESVAVVPADPSPSADVQHSESMVVPELKGIIFLPNPQAVHANGVAVMGVSASSVPFLQRSGFKEQIDRYLGHPLTFGQLNEITRTVVVFYRRNNHPLVNVFVPEQDVQSGTIQIVVTEYRVGQVRAQGNKWFSDRLVTASVALSHGDTIDSNQLLGYLDSANANPFRHVNLVYQPGAQQGYTDLILQTQDRFPIRAYTGYDNSGTPVTGRGRWNFGVNWGNALWHDGQLSYQFTSSSNFWTGASSPEGASFVAHSLSWTLPISGLSSVSVFGSYARTVPNIGQDFGLVGRSGQASIRYNLSLPRTEKFTQVLQAGYDYKVTNNNLAFGGTSISRNNTEIDQFPVTYTGIRNDRWGSTSVSTSLVFSPGGITPDNTDAAFQPAPNQSGRMMARANYVYWRNDVNRLTKLPAGMGWSSRFIGQISNSSLLNTEQIAVGGLDLLRGYDPYSILGDQGIVLSNELRSPSFGHSGRKEVRSMLLGETQLLTFWDYANLHNKNAVDTTLATINASSIGVGLRYRMRTFASVRFDYGWQLQQLPTDVRRGQLANVSVSLNN